MSAVEHVRIHAGPFELLGRLEHEKAPATCALFLSMLPLRAKLIHVRWSGEGVWIPFGERAFELPTENATRFPAVGEAIFYPGGFSEAEMLLPYGPVAFASKLGPLAGNHFLTVASGREHLPEIGRRVLWKGALAVSFEAAKGTTAEGRRASHKPAVGRREMRKP